MTLSGLSLPKLICGAGRLDHREGRAASRGSHGREEDLLEAGREAVKLKVEAVRLKAKELLRALDLAEKAASLRASARGRAACD